MKSVPGANRFYSFRLRQKFSFSNVFSVWKYVHNVGHEGAMELPSIKCKANTLTSHFADGMALLKIVC